MSSTLFEHSSFVSSVTRQIIAVCEQNHHSNLRSLWAASQTSTRLWPYLWRAASGRQGLVYMTQPVGVRTRWVCTCESIATFQQFHKLQRHDNCHQHNTTSFVTSSYRCRGESYNVEIISRYMTIQVPNAIVIYHSTLYLHVIVSSIPISLVLLLPNLAHA